MKQVEAKAEKCGDACLAYFPGLKGVFIGSRDSYEEGPANYYSARNLHTHAYGSEMLDLDSLVLNGVFV